MRPPAYAGPPHHLLKISATKARRPASFQACKPLTIGRRTEDPWRWGTLKPYPAKIPTHCNVRARADYRVASCDRVGHEVVCSECQISGLVTVNLFTAPNPSLANDLFWPRPVIDDKAVFQEPESTAAKPILTVVFRSTGDWLICSGSRR